MKTHVYSHQIETLAVRQVHVLLVVQTLYKLALNESLKCDETRSEHCYFTIFEGQTYLGAEVAAVGTTVMMFHAQTMRATQPHVLGANRSSVQIVSFRCVVATVPLEKYRALRVFKGRIGRGLEEEAQLT